MSYIENYPQGLDGALALTEAIFERSSHTFEGTNPTGYGAEAVNAVAFVVGALRQAQEAVYAAGEGGNI